MIKINLIQNQARGGVETEALNLPSSSPINQAEVLKRLGILLAAPLLLIGYEQINLSSLRSREADKMAELQAVQAKEAESKLKADEAKALQEQKAELEDKVKVLRDLSKARLGLLKVLDYIQNATPAPLWLTSFSLEGENMKIQGFSVNDDVLTNFLQKIEGQKTYFRDVLLLKSSEVKTGAGAVKNFEISGIVLKVD